MFEKTVSCATCVFYKPTQTVGTQLEIGICRRYPKHMDINPGHWCGEHRGPELFTLTGSHKRLRIVRHPDGNIGFEEES